MNPVADLLAGVSFLRRLPSFLRNPVTVDEARATVQVRLRNRESTFLRILRQGIYEHRASPYLQLLEHAGCEFSDIEGMVRKDGIEAALGSLFRAGVYLTVDELKVHHSAARGHTNIRVSPELLRNPLSSTHIWRASGGSRAMTVVGVDLSNLRDLAVNFQLFTAARKGLRWRHAIWVVPGATVYRILEFAAMGLQGFECFTQLDTNARNLHPYYRWSERMTHWAALWAGCPLPRPAYVPLNDPLPIVHWMRDVLQSGDVPHLWTSVSCAVRLCLAATEARIDLEGAQFTVSGEPLTSARLQVLEKAGAKAAPAYGSTETAWIGNGCLSPAAPGEQHLFHDRVALIHPGQKGDHGMPPDALLVTSLRPNAPIICLNVSLGDQAIIDSRRCGCEMEALGWLTHLHSIRSYEKLTATGMSFLDYDLLQILEVVLPERFGGSPTDYQLVEKDGLDSSPRLILRVSPSLGPMDEGALKKAFLESLGAGSGRERVMALLLRDSNLLQIERSTPETTASGKILHLLQSREQKDSDPG